MQRFSTDLVLYRAYADLKSETANTYLGILWWIIEPVTSMAIYYFVFSVILNRGTEDFVPFLLIGIVMWQWFAQAVTRGSRAIIQNQGLVRQAAVPKIVYPIVSLLTNTVKFAVTFVLLLVFLWVYGFDVGVYYTALPLLLLIELAIIAGATLPLSAIAPFLPDITNVLTHVIRIMFYLSGILYLPEKIPERYRWTLDYNPMAVTIQAYRDVLMYDQWPLMKFHLAVAFAVAIGGVVVGAYLLARLDPFYAKQLER